jgi:tetratricopeptide (TPR) repeat protein
MVQAELYQQNLDYFKANKSLLSLVDLLHSSPSVGTKNRLGGAYINLANNEMLLQRFETGIKFAERSREYFKQSQVNTNVAKEVEFLLHLCKGDLKIAGQLADELYESSSTQKASFLFYKRTYLYACLCNLKGDFKKSLQLLDEVKEIEKDKEGWNIGVRLLYIINLIDRKNYEAVESHVTSFKKYLARLRSNKVKTKRYSVVLRILTRLMNDDFRFIKTFKRSNKYFDLLQSGQESYAWSVKGPEVIAFHEWFVSRLEFRSYSYDKAFVKNQTN